MLSAEQISGREENINNNCSCYHDDTKLRDQFWKQKTSYIKCQLLAKSKFNKYWKIVHSSYKVLAGDRKRYS